MEGPEVPVLGEIWTMHDLLLIEATGDNSNEYRRIGFGLIEAFTNQEDYFFEVEKTEIILI
jgi:hypothetical protein